MATFSQRVGLKPLEKAIQLQAIDQDLRNALWNVMDIYAWSAYRPYDGYQYEDATDRVERLVVGIFLRLYKMAHDAMPKLKDAKYGEQKAFPWLRQVVMNGEWHEVYDLVDFIAREAHPSLQKTLVPAFNSALTRESAAYRFVSGELVEITERSEIEAIESAISKGSRDSKAHLERALQLLADRKAPDYRNSIKESISAVESVCKAIAGNPAATLGDAMKQLKKTRTVHPLLEQALIKLYGYTNDAGGIRHALTEASVDVTSEDARFMLVVCSSFCSYLWALSATSS
ncbi:AbiJ-NTD4 domain-containing protein [Variovorax sp. V15]|uniref:AbiJ-NTD4 domain-containing protein n=1 Tax=Variovorax sp. V15 TaxID=3065952 RepID=UPI0034E87638